MIAKDKNGCLRLLGTEKKINFEIEKKKKN